MRSILQHWLGGVRDSEPGATHLSLGRRGEEMAIEHLKSLGYRIVTTNFITPIGYSRKGRQIAAEIDVIAYDESARPFILCFVEVKTRSSAEIAPPEAAVDLRKQRHIVKAARIYRRMMNVADEPFRYDVVSVLLAPSREVTVDLLRGYFPEERFGRGES